MKCPTCGKELSCERGVRQHHTKVHGDPLPNRTCKGCGVEFYDEKARLNYCEDCNPNGGEHNGNYQGAKETAICGICGSEFDYYPSDKDGVYCPDCVEESDEFLGTPSYELREIERVTKTCEECEREIAVLKSRVERAGVRFCSRDCHSEWMAEDGRTHDFPYTGKWHAVKERALDRDDHECQSCGTTRSDLGHEPHVHHVEPIRDFDDPQDAHQLDNVVCLCPSCHRLAEIGKIPCPVP